MKEQDQIPDLWLERPDKSISQILYTSIEFLAPSVLSYKSERKVFADFLSGQYHIC